MSLHDIGVASGSRWCLSETRLRRADLNRSPASGPQRLQVLNRTEPARNLAEKTHQAHCFLQRDPLGMLRVFFSAQGYYQEGMNLYAYAERNPTVLRDPLGLLSSCPRLPTPFLEQNDCLPGDVSDEDIDKITVARAITICCGNLQARCRPCCVICCAFTLTVNWTQGDSGPCGDPTNQYIEYTIDCQSWCGTEQECGL